MRVKTAWIPIAALALATLSACAIPAAPVEPAAPATPTTFSSAPKPTESLQDKALDKIVTQVSTRASLAKYPREKLREIMDVAICPHQNDLMGMTQAAQTKGISAADAGYLLGANAGAGYC